MRPSTVHSLKYSAVHHSWRAAVGAMLVTATYAVGSFFGSEHSRLQLRDEMATREVAHKAEVDSLKTQVGTLKDQVATAVNRPAPVFVPPAVPHAPKPVVKSTEGAASRPVAKPVVAPVAKPAPAPLFSPTPLWERD